MSRKDKIKLIVADTLARVVVYGPLAVAAACFAPPALIVVALAAGQPWVGEAVGNAAVWLEKKYPDVMVPVDAVLSRYAGMPWWKHFGVLISALAVALVPLPAVASHLPGFVRGALGVVGGVDSAWSQFVVPFALATALPFATRLATDGFEWIFQQIPALRDASIQRQQDRKDRAGLRQAERDVIRSRYMAGMSIGVSSASVSTPPEGPAVLAMPAQAPADAPAPQPRLGVRRVAAASRQGVIVNRPRVLPEIVLLSTPPRVEVAQPHSTILDGGLAF